MLKLCTVFSLASRSRLGVLRIRVDIYYKKAYRSFSALWPGFLGDEWEVIVSFHTWRPVFGAHFQYWSICIRRQPYELLGSSAFEPQARKRVWTLSVNLAHFLVFENYPSSGSLKPRNSMVGFLLWSYFFECRIREIRYDIYGVPLRSGFSQL